MKFFSIFLFVFCLILTQNFQAQQKQMDIYNFKPSVDETARNKIYVPKNLNDCFVELKKILPPQFIENLRSKNGEGTSSEEIFLTSWVEENWGFRENSQLSRYFENYLQLAEEYKNEDIPKDVPEEFLKNIISEKTASFVVGVFQMYLSGEIVDGEKHMELIRKLGIASKPPKGKELVLPQCNSGIILEGDIEGESNEEPTIIHYGRCQSTNQLWVSERGKGWYLPDAALTKQIPSGSKIPKSAKLPKFEPIN